MTFPCFYAVLAEAVNNKLQELYYRECIQIFSISKKDKASLTYIPQICIDGQIPNLWCVAYTEIVYLM